MTIDALAALGGIQEPSLAPSASAFAALQPTADASASAAASSASGTSFGALVTQGLEQVNHGLVSGQVELQQLAAGEPVNLHQMMIHMEQSRLSFELLMQVRNRVLEAYQDVMRMQV